MRLPLVPILIVLASGLLADWYILCHMRVNTGDGPSRNRALWRAIYIIVSALVTMAMLTVTILPKKTGSEGQLLAFMWTIFTYFTVYIPKYLFCIFGLIRKVLSLIFRKKLRIITALGGAVSAALFILMWWGALFTRFSVNVSKVDIDIENLPAQFEGYRIAQISDIHTGTFGDNPRFLQKVVDRVNSLHPDIILFTGDIVNRHSSELDPFIATFSQLNAPDGVWSVMGNHDYGEYYLWPSEDGRLWDVENLKRKQAAMGWHMLNNDHTFIKRGNDSIALIGVENIGDPPFTTYGNLRKAYKTPGDRTTKVLMTHNPAHWTDSIADNPDVNIGLTLSGHTHAMQIKLLGWSPASIRYPTWGGHYSDTLGRSLYVNIGLGEVGFPSRIGATPEVTLITLKSKKNT